jgi:hypothetical protein
MDVQKLQLTVNGQPSTIIEYFFTWKPLKQVILAAGDSVEGY